MGRKKCVTGQSVVEYLIIISALVAGIMLAKGFMTSKMRDGYQHLSSELYDGMKKIDL